MTGENWFLWVVIGTAALLAVPLLILLLVQLVLDHRARCQSLLMRDKLRADSLTDEDVARLRDMPVAVFVGWEYGDLRKLVERIDDGTHVQDCT